MKSSHPKLAENILLHFLDSQQLLLSTQSTKYEFKLKL